MHPRRPPCAAAARRLLCSRNAATPFAAAACRRRPPHRCSCRGQRSKSIRASLPLPRGRALRAVPALLHAGRCAATRASAAHAARSASAAPDGSPQRRAPRRPLRDLASAAEATSNRWPPAGLRPLLARASADSLRPPLARAPPPAGPRADALLLLRPLRAQSHRRPPRPRGYARAALRSRPPALRPLVDLRARRPPAVVLRPR